MAKTPNLDKAILDEQEKQLIAEGIKLFRDYRPDRANILQMEDANYSIESIFALIKTQKTGLTEEKIIEMIDNHAEYYLKYLAKKNLEIEVYCTKTLRFIAAKDAYLKANPPGAVVLITRFGLGKNGGDGNVN